MELAVASLFLVQEVLFSSQAAPALLVAAVAESSESIAGFFLLRAAPFLVVEVGLYPPADVLLPCNLISSGSNLSLTDVVDILNTEPCEKRYPGYGKYNG